MFENFEGSDRSSTEDLLKSILKSAPYGIMTFQSVRDKNDDIIDFEWLLVNDVAEQIVGKSGDELIGKRLLNIMPGNEEAGLFEKYKQVVITGKYLAFELYYEEKNINGWFRISAVKLDDGLTVTFQDISDLKEAIQEATQREKKYRKLFQESIDAIFIINDEYQFIDINAAFSRHFGYKLDDLQCFSLISLFAKKPDFNLFTKTLVSQNGVEEYEAILVDENGNSKSCFINCFPLIDDESKRNVFQGVIRDVTKRKKAEQEILQAEKLSMTGKIARSIAHEVRNPLTNVTLALEQLKDEIPEKIEDAELYFSIIQRNIERIGKLISELLDSSKPKELNLQPQSINNVVKEALELVEDRFKLQSMDLKERFDTNLPNIDLDKDLMKVALLNLFINAVEAMRIDKGSLEVSTFRDDDKMLLTIEDNGKGISEEDLDLLFEPFFTAKKNGMGLGLTTVQNIVQSHKANISVESELGKGTKFLITFKL